MAGVAHCFTYGSLMCADIMAAVAGSTLGHESAKLRGYRRHPVTDEDYPGMVESAGDAVAGVLYRDVPASGLVRLDAFEGEMYARAQVIVELAGGCRLPAWAYVFKPEYRHLLRPGDWDFETFLRAGKTRFEARYLGFDRINHD